MTVNMIMIEGYVVHLFNASHVFIDTAAYITMSPRDKRKGEFGLTFIEPGSERMWRIETKLT